MLGNNEVVPRRLGIATVRPFLASLMLDDDAADAADLGHGGGRRASSAMEARTDRTRPYRPPEQEPPPTIRVDTEVARGDVTVLERRGRRVTQDAAWTDTGDLCAESEFAYCGARWSQGCSASSG
jgi:hypothetical protein